MFLKSSFKTIQSTQQGCSIFIVFENNFKLYMVHSYTISKRNTLLMVCNMWKRVAINEIVTHLLWYKQLI